jgi:hypothetical protein
VSLHDLHVGLILFASLAFAAFSARLTRSR